MSDLTNEKMKCWGCKADKPKSDFDKNPALCRRCVGARVVTTSKKRGSVTHKDMAGNFVMDVLEGLADAISDLLH